MMGRQLIYKEASWSKIMKKVNYHTHTNYCGHASGRVQDYVNEALKKELEILGFSDHMPFPGNQYDSRMQIEDMENYLKEVEKSRQAVKNKLTIYAGFESEYIREHHNFYEEVLKTPICDYLILGQHMVWDHMRNRKYAGNLPSTDWYLLYMKGVMEGMHTQYFKAVAHPDIIFMNNQPWDYCCEKACSMLIEDALQHKYILEYNANGYRRGVQSFVDGRRYQYPYLKFWEQVGKTDIPIVIGSDCHEPQLVYDNYVEKAYEDAGRLGLNIITDLFYND